MSVLATEPSVHGWSIEHLDENYSRTDAEQCILESVYRRDSSCVSAPVESSKSGLSGSEINLYFVSLPFGKIWSKPTLASSDRTLEIPLMGTLALTETSSSDIEISVTPRFPIRNQTAA